MAAHTHEVVPVDGTPRYPPRDDELRRRLVYGDESALGEAYDAFGALVRAVARRVTCNAHTADEVTREVFLELWTHPYAFVPGHGSLRAWLSMLAHHKAVARVTDAPPESSGGLPGAEAEAARAADARSALMLHAALAELPLPQREAMHLACFAGRTYRQVAVELGIPEATATSRLRAALSDLADRLAAAPDPSSPANGARDDV
ncbi:sigma-70 family RNA polymerase sigma factor [Streptomyces sp. NPDC003077]|uniref:RNA polymerase sigma factor n=1 Tax=Streptomyces sp. NPDC003077 TaxID=3154443 RepID=UPI0033AFAEAC